MKASIGRVVHFTDEGECQAAIVIDVNDDNVDLAVFDKRHGYQQHREVFSDPVTVGQAWNNGQWHWPERIDE